MNNSELKLAQILLEAAHSCLVCGIDNERERIFLLNKMESIKNFASELNHVALYGDKDPIWSLDIHRRCPDFDLHSIIREAIQPYLELLEVYEDGS